MSANESIFNQFCDSSKYVIVLFWFDCKTYLNEKMMHAKIRGAYICMKILN